MDPLVSCLGTLLTNMLVGCFDFDLIEMGAFLRPLFELGLLVTFSGQLAG